MGFTVFLVLITIVCLLLIIVIMVQNPKGGGLSSTFGSSQQMGGVQKTTDFLDKSTWTLGIVLIGLILLSGLSFEGETGSRIMSGDSGAPVTQPVQTTPVTTEQAVEVAPDAE